MSIIHPRSTWGPRYSNGFAVIGTREWESAGKEIWLHHSVTNPPGPDATLAQDCAHMRDFELIGQNRFGGGISYTWVIMPSGRVFQGHDIDRQGSHTYQRNNRARAICFAGMYHINPLPDRMANAAAALLRELGATIDGPHSAVYATDCPGENARKRIGYINELAVSGRPIGDDDMANLNEQKVPVSGAPEGNGKYDEMANIALGAAAGNARTAVVRINELTARVNAVAEDVRELRASGVPVDVKLSDDDVERVADRVAAKLAQRLES